MVQIPLNHRVLFKRGAVNRILIHLKKLKTAMTNTELSSPGSCLKMGQQQNSNSMCQTLTFSLQTSDRQ